MMVALSSLCFGLLLGDGVRQQTLCSGVDVATSLCACDSVRRSHSTARSGTSHRATIRQRWGQPFGSGSTDRTRLRRRVAHLELGAVRPVASTASPAEATAAAAAAAVSFQEIRGVAESAPPHGTTVDNNATGEQPTVSEKKDMLLRLLLTQRHRSSGREDDVDKRAAADVGGADGTQQPKQQQLSAQLYWQQVASCINDMEGRYTSPPQTLDFFHFVTGGTWIHVLCTRRQPFVTSSSSLMPRLHVKGVEQHVVNANGRNSTAKNVVQWELREILADVGDGTSGSSAGTFEIVCEAQMSPTGSSRQHLEAVDRTLELNRGSDIPRNVPQLVQLLSRHVPSTLWDPSGAAMDTTYLDADLRIVRYTGTPRLEGVRDVFVRKSVLDQYNTEREGKGDDGET